MFLLLVLYRVRGWVMMMCLLVMLRDWVVGRDVNINANISVRTVSPYTPSTTTNHSNQRKLTPHQINPEPPHKPSTKPSSPSPSTPTLSSQPSSPQTAPPPPKTSQHHPAPSPSTRTNYHHHHATIWKHWPCTRRTRDGGTAVCLCSGVLIGLWGRACLLLLLRRRGPRRFMGGGLDGGRGGLRRGLGIRLRG